MKVTLAQLTAFVAVVDAGGFSAAADELSATQSALSYAVGSLEKTLGGPVFRRQPHVALTPLGDAILEHARETVAAADRLVLAADMYNGKSVGTVRLAASTTARAGLVPGLIELWKRHLPGVQIRVLEGEDDEMATWLDEGIVDAAILIDPSDPHPDARIVAQDKYHAVVRDDHPYGREDSMPLAHLLEDPILVSDTGCWTQIMEMCRDVDPRFRPAQDVRDLATITEMVAAGVGVSILPTLGRRLIPEALPLVLVPLTPIIERTLVLTGPRERPWGALVEQLISAAPTQPNKTT